MEAVMAVVKEVGLVAVTEGEMVVAKVVEAMAAEAPVMKAVKRVATLVVVVVVNSAAAQVAAFLLSISRPRWRVDIR